MAASKRSENRVSAYNIWIIACACFGSITYGYCAGIVSTTLGQPTFLNYFHLDSAGNAAAIKGAINGLFQGGGAFGAFLGGSLADKRGRVPGILVACIFCATGGALQAGSVHIAMYLIARFITGCGVGQILVLVPLWQSELAPAHARGLLVGLHGVAILVGYSIATWLGVVFFFVSGSGIQWRVPLALQVIPPLLLASVLPFIPESPRWLLENGKEEAARRILGKIHHESQRGDSTHLVDMQFEQIKAKLFLESTLPSSWLSLFTIPSYRRRALVGFLTLFSGQLTGTMVIINYGPSLYASLGYTDAVTLMLTAGWITLGLPGNMVNAYLLDIVGRRLMLAIGIGGCCICLLGEIVMLAEARQIPSKGLNIAAIVFLFLFQTFYAFCVDASTYVYSCEIWPTHLRARGFSLSILGLFCGSLIVLISAPTAFDRIGWRFYLVFLVCSIFSTVIIFWIFPETKGLSLEEIGTLFGDDIAVMESGSAVENRVEAEEIHTIVHNKNEILRS